MVANSLFNYHPKTSLPTLLISGVQGDLLKLLSTIFRKLAFTINMLIHMPISIQLQPKLVKFFLQIRYPVSCSSIDMKSQVVML